MSPLTLQTSFPLLDLVVARRLAALVTSYNTKAKPSWYSSILPRSIKLWTDCFWQLDAGMHTGKEGTEAMPYFDTFDLETIDILLISQYVLPFSFQRHIGEDLGNGMLKCICLADFEDDQDDSKRQQSFDENRWSYPLGIESQSIVLLEQTSNTNLFTTSPSLCFDLMIVSCPSCFATSLSCLFVLGPPSRWQKS
jgi:hypothetical protein